VFYVLFQPHLSTVETFSRIHGEVLIPEKTAKPCIKEHYKVQFRCNNYPVTQQDYVGPEISTLDEQNNPLVV